MSISKSAIAATGIFVAVSLAPLTAVSQPQCLPRDDLVSILAMRYDESLAGKGLANTVDGLTAVELFTTPNGGTFTVLATGPKIGADGQRYMESCIITAGDHWMIFTPGTGL